MSIVDTEDSRLTKARELNRAVTVASLAWHDANEIAKAKKKRWEAAQDELNRFLSDLDAPRPLFDGLEATVPAVVSETDGEDLSWRDVPLRTLDIPPKTLKILEEQAIRTIGGVFDWTKAGKQLTDLDGIGPAGAEKIDEALARFWSEWARIKGVESTADVLPPPPENVEPPDWRETPLALVVGQPIASAIATNTEMVTVGDLAEYLSSNEAEDLCDGIDGPLTAETCKTFLVSLRAWRHQQGWDANVQYPHGIPLAWIQDSATFAASIKTMKHPTRDEFAEAATKPRRWQDIGLMEILHGDEKADIAISEKVRVHLELKPEEEPTVGDIALIWFAEGNRIEDMKSLTLDERGCLRAALAKFRMDRGWLPNVALPNGFPLGWLSQPAKPKKPR